MIWLMTYLYTEGSLPVTANQFVSIICKIDDTRWLLVWMNCIWKPSNIVEQSTTSDTSTTFFSCNLWYFSLVYASVVYEFAYQHVHIFYFFSICLRYFLFNLMTFEISNFLILYFLLLKHSYQVSWVLQIDDLVLVQLYAFVIFHIWVCSL